MIKIKVIKTKQDYEEALKLVADLMNHDPDPNSDEGEQLELLSTLIQDYEAKTFPTRLPNPIDAIKFRMEQAGLSPGDLIPYLGSRSRVSEIFSGKRQLTIDMIRALEAGLGIPAKVLIQNSILNNSSEYQNWDSHLVTEMESRGYFENTPSKKYSKVELLENFFLPFGSPAEIIGMARKSHYRSLPLSDKNAFAAWAVYVFKQARKIKVTKKYRRGIVGLKFMQELVKLSIEDNGPILAQEYLKEHGIILVIERHFPRTYLDGATILMDKDYPVIGLTLRYDRLDNFWFTLMHELAHLAQHYDSGISLFYDEIEGIKTLDLDEKEQQADALAEEAILPKAKWEVSPARLIPSYMAADSLANELGVHVAIVAGQIRHKGNKYIYLNKIVNAAKVRKYFTNIKWDK